MLRTCLVRLPLQPIPLSFLFIVALANLGLCKQNQNHHQQHKQQQLQHQQQQQPSSGHHDLRYVIEEECDVGTTIGHLTTGAGLDSQYPAEVVRQLRFRFLSPAPGFLIVEESSGRLYVAGHIDRDVICRPEVEICLIQEDVAVQPVQYFRIIKVTVEIRDINDHRPAFIPDQVVHEMSESAVLGVTSVLLPTAFDPDSKKFSVKRYQLESISPIEDRDVFQLKVSEKMDGSTEVRLVLARSLDREKRDIHRIIVAAVDGGQLTGSLDVSVVVIDANDNAPIFDGGGHYEVRLVENSPRLTSITRVNAVDDDIGENGRVVYSLAASSRASYGHLFAVNNATGEILVIGNVDYETTPVCHLIIVATDCGTPPEVMSSEATVVVNVEDTNDNGPVIVVNTLYDSDTDVAHVTENASPSTFIGHVIVTDPDRGPGGRFNCTLGASDGDDDEHFRLRHVSGGEYHVITSAASLDRERQKRYRTSVVCQDFGVPSMSTVKSLTVDVLDVNDNAPRFARYSYSVTVPENAEVGTTVLRVNASDVDESSVIVYGISKAAPSTTSAAAAAHFAVDAKTGLVTVASKLDRESIPRYQFQLYAVDGSVEEVGDGATGNVPVIGAVSLTATAKIVVHVTDVNDERPIFTHGGAYQFQVSERRPAGTEVGTVSANDADLQPFNDFRFEISSAPVATGNEFDNRLHHHHQWLVSAFSIDSKTGCMSTTRELDREHRDVYQLLVLARDSVDSTLVSTATVTVLVDDVNDNAPIFLFPFPSNRTTEVVGPIRRGHRVATMRAVDADAGPNGRIRYAIVGQLPRAARAEVAANSDVLSENRERSDASEFLPFVLDADTGELFTSIDITIPAEASNLTFVLPLLATDGGQTPFTTSTHLQIVVVRWSDSAASYRVHASGLTLADDNVAILIAVCSLTVVIVIVLLAAILFVACQHSIVAAVDRIKWHQNRTGNDDVDACCRRRSDETSRNGIGQLVLDERRKLDDRNGIGQLVVNEHRKLDES